MLIVLMAITLGLKRSSTVTLGPSSPFSSTASSSVAVFRRCSGTATPFVLQVGGGVWKRGQVTGVGVDRLEQKI